MDYSHIKSSIFPDLAQFFFSGCFWVFAATLETKSASVAALRCFTMFRGEKTVAIICCFLAFIDSTLISYVLSLMARKPQHNSFSVAADHLKLDSYLFSLFNVAASGASENLRVS